MALPSLAIPEFRANLPSTGKEVRFRPFLVKEEKILLMALEGGDEKEIINAILNVLQNCILDDLDVRKMPSFDVEYLYMHLRAKSVNEIISMRLGHRNSECLHKTDVEIPINDIKVIGKISNGVVKLTDTVGIKFKYPGIEDLNVIGDAKTENIFELIYRCVESVYDENDVYTEFDREELEEWLEQLNKEQFEKIGGFFSEIPKLSYIVNWTCPACGESDSAKVEGLASFFI